MSDGAPDQLRTFALFLAALEDGRLHAELSDQLGEIVATLNDHRAEYGGEPKATVSLSLTFQLKGGTIEVIGATKTTLPKSASERTILWSTPDNHLSRANPKQQKLPFGRDVTQPRQPATTL